MSQSVRRRRAWLCATCSWRLLSFAAASFGVVAAVPANAGQLQAGAFQVYNSATASTIQPGPFALYTVPVDSLAPTQMNEGFQEVDKKADGFNILQPSQQETTASLLGDIEPVVIGPGGKLYLTDGHHTFTALEDSAYGSSNLPVYVNIIANFSSDTTAQFWAQMQADNFLLPLNDGVPETVNTTTGAPIPATLQGLTADVYRGLEYSILKNKNSKLFTNSSNIAHIAGSAIPGLDKITGLYGDFIWADAYRNANGGLGLPYLSPGDIQLATQWNLTPTNPTFEPNIPLNSQISGPNGANVEVGQLPGSILNGNIVINGTISNTTLANGTLDGTQTGTFDETSTFASFKGITQFNLGTPTNPIMVGTAQSGFVMQLGADSSHTVTLTGNNTYTGGTYFIAGTLIVNGDAALGAAPTETASQFNSALNINAQGFPTTALAAVQGDNGIVFDSLTEGNGTLEITSSFATSRPIGVDGEVANLNPNGNTLTLNGPIVSLGTNGVGLGNATGVSDLTVNDTSTNANGSVVLPSTANNPNFYGNWIITAGILNVSSDAALGDDSVSGGSPGNGVALPASELGEIELNGGTLQAGASFSSVRSLFMGGGSTIDTNGYSISFAGNMQDIQRTLVVENSNTSGTNAAGAVSFGTFEIGGTATLNVNAGSGTGGGDGTSVTFTNGIIRDPASTLILQPTTSPNLGTLAQGTANSEDVFNGLSSQNTPVNGIVAPWIVIYGATPGNGTLAAQTPASPYSFATYGANGYTAATVGGAITNNILTSTNTNTVIQSTSITGGTVTANLQAYALSVQNGTGIALNGHTLTLGDGTNPAGLILNGGASITGGTLAFGGSEGVIWLAGQGSAGATPNVNTISATITGTGGLTFAGGLHATDLSQVTAKDGLSLVNITTASTETGAIVIDSGAVGLNAVNVFSSSAAGITLDDTKSSPAPATLNVNANNVLSALNSVGNNSAVNIASGDTLTIGDSQNLNSTLTSTITGTSSGSLIKAGTGLLDISGGAASFGSTGTVSVIGGALRIGNGVFGASATTVITVASGAELQYSGNAGSKFNDPIHGAGDFNLLAGTVQLTSTGNTYAGGTNIQIGATLDVTTANLPTGGAISNAGGNLLFDQTASGTFSGIMSDGIQAGGPTDPNDVACTVAGITCGSSTTLAGTLIRDDSTNGGSNITTTSISTVVSTYVNNNVTLSSAQTYTGPTYVEAGALTLGAVNTIAGSSGVTLGRVGGGATAVLALGAANQIAGLADNPSNASSPNHDYVLLNGNTLTIATASGTSWSFGGQIADGTASGNLAIGGSGTEVLTGTSSYTGTTTVSGGTLDVEGTLGGTSGVTVNSGGTLVGGGTIDPPTTTVISGTFAPGAPGSPGTSMTINGNLQFNSGATYIVQLNSTTSTFANVTGTAALAGNVLAAFTPGSYQAKQYTILESTGLNSTTFNTLGTANLPNFNASLSYSTNDVFLNLTASLGPSGGGNGNKGNVANSLNNFFNSGGTLTPNFATIFGLSGGNLNTALAQLSGEANTAGQNASFEMMSDFLGVMVDPTAGGCGGSPGSAGSAFAAEQTAEMPSDIASAYASVLRHATPPAPFEQRWTAWGQGFGGYNRTDGNAAAGTNTVTATASGFAGGLDYHFTPDTFAGFAVAGSGNDWSLANNLGSGRSNSMQIGLYGTSYFGRAYVAGSVGFANHWMTTNRFAPLGDQLTANFNAQSYGARLEGGYRFGFASFGVSPYAALQTQLFHTPGYSETDPSGGGFGLSYAAQNPTDTRSELGARFDSLQVINNMPLVWRARLAWAHDWVSSPTLTATFETLPGANFVVNGAGMPANSALTSLGAELYMTPHWSVEAKFDGDFANTAQTYAGTGTVRYRW